MIKIVVYVMDRVNGHKHLSYVKYDLDDGKPFCYRSRTSHNAFFHNHKTNRNQTDRHLYAAKHEVEHQINLDVWAEMMREHPGLEDIYSKVPVVEVQNIWEFYELIGYDHKTKRWLA